MRTQIFLGTLMLMGAGTLSAAVYVGGGVGVGIGVVGGGVISSPQTSTTVTTTTTTAQNKPEANKELTVSGREGGESPLSAGEAAWVLSRTNLITGASFGDIDGLSEQAFAIASLVHQTEVLEASKTLKDIFDSANSTEGKLYAVMGMHALGNLTDFNNYLGQIDMQAPVNCLVNGKFYTVTTEVFINAYSKQPSIFVPETFPTSKVAALTPTSAPSDSTSSTTTTSTTTSTVSTSSYYYSGFGPIAYWTPAYLYIRVRPCPPRPPYPPHPPVPPRPRMGHGPISNSPTMGARPAMINNNRPAMQVQRGQGGTVIRSQGPQNSNNKVTITRTQTAPKAQVRTQVQAQGQTRIQPQTQEAKAPRQEMRARPQQAQPKAAQPQAQVRQNPQSQAAVQRSAPAQRAPEREMAGRQRR